MTFRFVFLLFILLSILALIAVAQDPHDAKRFSYLDILSDSDLVQFLEEYQVGLNGDESREVLLQKVIAIEKANEESGASKGSKSGSGHRVDVRYCVGCGYKDQFSKFAQLLRQRLPQVEITSGNKQASATGQFIGGIAQYGIYFSILLLIVAHLLDGKHPLAPFIKEYRTPILIGGYLLTNIGQQALSTGAFEVSLDGKSVYSKLETGRMPDIHQLADVIVSSIQKGIQQRHN